MDIEYKGANCVSISVKKSTIFTDPKLSDQGLKDQGATATVQLLTQSRFGAPHDDDTLVITGPGEYEVQNISIQGIGARAYMDADPQAKGSTMYSIKAADITVVITGHVHPSLNEEQLEALGVTDVLVVPVGGNGYTLDATGAVELVRKIDPKIIIPTHYADKSAKYEVPQAELEQFVKELGATVEVINKLKLKAATLNETLTVYQLNRVA